MSSSAPSPEQILQVGMGFFASKTLLSAVEMEVFTELARHPEDLETLAGRLGLHPRSSRDFLDTLVAPDSWNGMREFMRIRRPRTCSWTSTSPRTLVEFWRWPTAASTCTGTS